MEFENFGMFQTDSSYIYHELHHQQYNILTIIYVVLNPPSQYMIGNLYYYKV